MPFTVLDLKNKMDKQGNPSASAGGFSVMDLKARMDARAAQNEDVEPVRQFEITPEMNRAAMERLATRNPNVRPEDTLTQTQRIWNPEAGISGNIAAPLAAGAATVANTGTLGALGAALAQLGRARSGMNEMSRSSLAPMFQRAGIPDEAINSAYSDEHNLPARAGKWLLDKANEYDKEVGAWQKGYTGDNPSFSAEVSNTIGNQGGFFGLKLLNPWLGNALEAAHNAAAAQMRATAAGQHEQGLNAAPYTFATKMAQGMALDKLGDILGKLASPMTNKITKPWLKKAVGAGGNVANEIADEAGDNVTDRATDKTVEQSGGALNYLGNLAREAGKLPQDLKEVAPTVGASSALVAALMAAAGLGSQRAKKALKTGAPEVNDGLSKLTERGQTDIVKAPERPSGTAGTADTANYDGASYEELKAEYEKLGAEVAQEINAGTVDEGKIRTLNAISAKMDEYRRNWRTQPQAAPQTTPQTAQQTAETTQEAQPKGALAAALENATRKPENVLENRTEPAPKTEQTAQTGQLMPEKAGNTASLRGADTLHSDIADRPDAALPSEAREPGRLAKVRTAAGTEVGVRYRVMSADDLIASNDENGEVNPNYPQELQPRQRDRESSQRQINRIANTLDPELLGENRMASDGAPIVGPDRVVESGNGRVMAIRKAYRTGQAGNYETWMRQNAARFGLSEADFDGVKNPVLVRERTGDVDRARFAREANEASVSRMSRTEQARADAARITPEMLAEFDPERPVESNRNFVQMFAERIVGKNEAGGFMTADGQLSQEGRERMTNALFAKAYGDTGTLNRLSESLDDEIRNVTNAMLQAAPRVAALENAVEGGGAKPELSIKEDVSAAANMLAQLRREGTSVADFIAQVKMFEDADLSDGAKRILQFMENNRRSAKRLTAMLNRYAELARNEGAPNQGTMFDTGRDKAALLKEAMKYARDPEGATQGRMFDEDEDKGPVRIEASEEERESKEINSGESEKTEDKPAGEAALRETIKETGEEKAEGNKAGNKQEPETAEAGNAAKENAKETPAQKRERVRQEIKDRFIRAGYSEDAAEETSRAYLEILGTLSESSDADIEELAGMMDVVEGGEGRGNSYNQARKLDGNTLNLFDENGNPEAVARADDIVPEAQVEAVRKQYKGTPQWMKAPNGKKTNLTEKQWLQVRTGAFKKWFGDWEKAAHRFTVIEAKTAEFNNTDDAVKWASKNGIVGLMKADETNGKGEINISVNSIREMLNPRQREKSASNEVHFAALTKLRDIIRESELVDSHPDYKKGADGKRGPENGVTPGITIDVIYGAFRLGGQDYRVKTTLKRFAQADTKTKAYAYDVSKIEVLSGTLGQLENQSNPTDKSSIPGNILLHGIRDNKGNLVVDNASKVVDENGEPKVVYHNTSEKRRVFDRQYVRKSMEIEAHFFAPNIDPYGEYGPVRNDVFLNIKNPADYKTAYDGFRAGRTDDAGIKQREKLQAQGYDGGIMTEDGEVYEYFVFDSEQVKSATDNRGTFDAADADIYHQDSGTAETGKTDGARAYTEFVTSAEGLTKGVIHMLRNADASSGIHEGAHIFLELMKKLDDAGRLNADGKLLLRNIMNEWGRNLPHHKDSAEAWRMIHEKFASSVEKYMMRGEAPSSRLKSTFEAFKSWLKKIYTAMKNITWTDTKGKQHKFNLTSEMTRTLDRIFTATDRAEAREAQTNETPEQTDEIMDRLREAGEKGDTKTVTETVNTPDNPFVETAEPRTKTEDAEDDGEPRFLDEETERGFVRSREREPKFEDKLIAALQNGEFKELKGDKTASGEKKAPLREAMRQMARWVKAAPTVVSRDMAHLKNLSGRQYDILTRKMILDDLTWRKQDKPDADLPWGLTAESLKKEHERFTRFAEKDRKIMDAIAREREAQKKLREDYVKWAEELGWHDLAKKIRNPFYFHHAIFLDTEGESGGKGGAAGAARTAQNDNAAGGDAFSRLAGIIQSRGYLKKYEGSLKDMSANYATVTGAIRIQMSQDIAVMRTLAEIKKKYDKGAELRAKRKPGERLSDLVPEGYAVYDPRGGGLVEGGGVNLDTLMGMAAGKIAEDAESVAEDVAGPEVYKQSGLAGDIANKITEMLAEHENQLLVIPKELKDALTRAAEKRKMSGFMKALNRVTHGWKLWTLYSPFRTLKYNLRNITGDLDAVMAGNPRALLKTKRAFMDLTAVMLAGREAKGDVRDYMERGWAQSTETHNLLDDGQLTFGFEEEEIRRHIELQKEMEAQDWTTKPKRALKKSLKLLNKATWGGIQHLTEFREQILRYACYLSYKEQMEADLKRGGEGRPDNWGASLEEEVMSLGDIKDRAYKMANELMGAYDQVSEFGQKLRRFAVPFYSWMEVNARRYWRLFTNGMKTGEMRKDFAKGFVKGTLLKSPLYACRLAKWYAMINFFSAACKLWNWVLFPDDDDDLPPEVRDKPHLTFGRDRNGRVLYFDRIGATADIMDWIGEDESLLPFVSSFREIMNGQQTVTGWLKGATSAAASKAFNGLNPLLKMPLEIATGKTYYPDVTKPRTIRDIWDYAASAIGLTREARALRGEPGPKYFDGDGAADKTLNWLGEHMVYSVDPKEGAYYAILDRVRQFQERVLGKTFDGAATTRRGTALRKLKTALRFKDRANVRWYLKEYYQLGGTKKGLKTSMQKMGPLAGLSKEERGQFLRWLPKDERKYLSKAMTYYRELAGSLGGL